MLQPLKGTSGTVSSHSKLSSIVSFNPSRVHLEQSWRDIWEQMDEVLQPLKGTSGTPLLCALTVAQTASTPQGYIWNTAVAVSDEEITELQPLKGTSGTLWRFLVYGNPGVGFNPSRVHLERYFFDNDNGGSGGLQPLKGTSGT